MRALYGRPGVTSRIGSRLLVLAIGVLVVLVVALPGSAGAADRVIARDTHINQVLALDGVVVYSRFDPFGPPLKRGLMRIVNGRVSVVHAMAPRRAGESVGGGTSIGLDVNGRVVVPFSRDRFVHHVLASQQWWIYDVAADRSRPLSGLPANLDQCSELSIWGSRLAYDTCNNPYLRIGSRTRKVPIPPGRALEWAVGQGSGRLTLRGTTLFGQVDDGSDGVWVALLADASGFCRHRVPSLGFGDASTGYFDGPWWLSRRYLMWQAHSSPGVPAFPLYRAQLRGHCRLPGPTELVFTPPQNGSVLAVDDRFIYYGDFNTIRRHRLPSQPSTASRPSPTMSAFTAFSLGMPLG